MFALHFNTCLEASLFENSTIFNIQEFSVNIMRRGEENNFARNESSLRFLGFLNLVLCCICFYILTHGLMKVSRISV